METKQELAVRVFENGLNCGQSVLAAFCEDYGLSTEMALKIAGGLGSGFRSGELCGAAAGAALIIGLKYGQSDIEDRAAKFECNAKTAEFLKAFKERNGYLLCRELLKRDAVEHRALGRSRCADIVRDTVAALEEAGY